ncbi:MAG: site-specific DNA-methyltransferase [Parcubacteria group bacterium]
MTIDLYCGDALDLLPTLDGPFDAIITDLPYGTTACKWDTVIPFGPMWAQVKRLLKPRGAFVTTASQPFTSALVMSNPTWFKYEWVWEKNTVCNPILLRTQPNKTHESILVFSQNSCIYNPQKQLSRSKQAIDNARKGRILKHKQGQTIARTGMVLRDQIWQEYVSPTSVQRFDSVPRATGLVHPAQKPVALYEYLIRTYTNEGDTVLDFVMGSGTTGVAAINTGRSFVGVELDAGYYAIAQRRIADAQAQLALPILEVAAS